MFQSIFNRCFQHYCTLLQKTHNPNLLFETAAQLFPNIVLEEILKCTAPMQHYVPPDEVSKTLEQMQSMWFYRQLNDRAECEC